MGDAQRDLPKPAVPPGPGSGPGTGAVPAPASPPILPLVLTRTPPSPTSPSLPFAAAKGRKLTITFTTSEAGRATIRLLRELPGRRKGKTCSATRKSGKGCTIRKSYRSIAKVVAKAGKIIVIVNGKVGKKALVAGAARVEVTVRDAAGNTSALAAKGDRVRR